MRRCKSEKVGDFKMGVMDVIKYNGRPDVFAWKYPGEELGTWSQLVVNQSQEAVLVKGGCVRTRNAYVGYKEYSDSE